MLIETADLTLLSKQAYDIAKSKGFHEDDKNLNRGQMLMLIVSELGEAMEALRKNRRSICGTFTGALKESQCEFEREPEAWAALFEVHVKDTFEDEIADAVIRLLDLAHTEEIDIEWHVKNKMLYNSTRPRLHGKKF